MTFRALGFFVALALAAGAATAAAQEAADAPAKPPRRPVAFVSVDGGMLATTSRTTATVTYKLYGEDARLQATYETKAAPVFGARAGIRVWRGLTVGAGVSLLAKNPGAPIAAKLPHPFYFQRLRDVEGTAADVEHKQSVIYAEIGYIVPLNPRFDLTLLAGPAFFSVTQEVAVKVQFSENYPFDTARFTGVESASKQADATGFTVGADLAWRPTRTIGVGALVRYSRATVSVSPVTGQSLTLDLGGLHTLAGVRLRF